MTVVREEPRQLFSGDHSCCLWQARSNTMFSGIGTLYFFFFQLVCKQDSTKTHAHQVSKSEFAELKRAVNQMGWLSVGGNAIYNCITVLYKISKHTRWAFPFNWKYPSLFNPINCSCPFFLQPSHCPLAISYEWHIWYGNISFEVLLWFILNSRRVLFYQR